MPHVIDLPDADAEVMNTTPCTSVHALTADPYLVGGNDDRFTGFGIMGLPFSSGHYLALRSMVASSVGPAYRTVWHRDPEGEWTIYTTTDPERSCPRYFVGSDHAVRVSAIDLRWQDDWTLNVALDTDTTKGTRLAWQVRLGSGLATRAMTTMGGATPQWAWNSTAVLQVMGPMASGVLGSGRIRLAGTAPNGQRFRAAPLRVWRVVESTATLSGEDFGDPAPLDTQARLGDFWLPQRGLFFVGRARFGTDVRTSEGGRRTVGIGT
ncbi:hypothetical protein [Gordonia sp. (in: high G+C Gram-positive bacteria)]|uniref:hypothetical protein n=1 Tax=Gordonia sp. (in: high G+C Gram-positive bacteria) TaxID=84139 RepID=UPI003C788A37